MITLTPEQRSEAEARIKAGSTEADLAAWLRLPVKRVKKLFRHELQASAADAKHEVLSKLYEAAVSGKNLTVSMFWAKARHGWRDTGPRETSAFERLPRHRVEIDGAPRD